MYAQNITEEAKSVRATVSGIVSYARWSVFSGPLKLCILSSSRFPGALKDTGAGALPYLPIIIRMEQEILVSQCDGFCFGRESPTYQVELKNKYPAKTLLLIAEQNPECVIDSTFYFIIKGEDMRFSVNMDSPPRSGVRVSPDILMFARSDKHG